jgi:hypothetical protein
MLEQSERSNWRRTAKEVGSLTGFCIYVYASSSRAAAYDQRITLVLSSVTISSVDPDVDPVIRTCSREPGFRLVGNLGSDILSFRTASFILTPPL